jgi:2-haloacid dehalogenase
MMAKICLFDVNETLLDLGSLDPFFAQVFGDSTLRKAWFTQMLQSALVSTITRSYASFGALGVAALEMLAARQQITLSDTDRQRLRDGMQQLAPHPEVVESLELLRNAGLRLATLTNSTLQVAEAQLHYAGIRGYFEQVFSADTVQRLKPAPEPYQMAAQQLGVQISELRLIAAHSWDIAGALHVGCAGAFVARPGMVLDPLVPQPDIVGSDLRAVTTKIFAAEAIA